MTRPKNPVELSLTTALAPTDPLRRQLPPVAEMRRWAAAACADDEAVTIAVRVVGETEGRALNRQWRDRDYATNVLSFPCPPLPGIEPRPLGDIVLCAPVVVAEAAAQDKPVSAHWAHLLVHGILHLQGHDHHDDAEAAAMEGLEQAILARLGLPDPYRQST